MPLSRQRLALEPTKLKLSEQTKYTVIPTVKLALILLPSSGTPRSSQLVIPTKKATTLLLVGCRWTDHSRVHANSVSLRHTLHLLSHLSTPPWTCTLATLLATHISNKDNFVDKLKPYSRMLANFQTTSHLHCIVAHHFLLARTQHCRCTGLCHPLECPRVFCLHSWEFQDLHSLVVGLFGS